jgi:anti-anti-sigma regulatory factor
MRDNLNTSTSDRPHAAVRGPHHIDPASWKPVAQGEFELRARLLVRPVGEAIIVKCFSTQVPFDDPETAELGASLMWLVKLGYVRILLNLQGVHFASGSLLCSLACVHQHVVKARGFLRLFGLEPIVRDALRICHLDTALEIYASEAEALSANRSRPAAKES